MFYTAQVRECWQSRSDRAPRCNFTTANRDFSRAPASTAHGETLPGHVCRTGWIHLNKDCKSHLRITANTQTVDPRPNSSSNTSWCPHHSLVICIATTALKSPMSFFWAKNNALMWQEQQNEGISAGGGTFALFLQRGGSMHHQDENLIQQLQRWTQEEAGKGWGRVTVSARLVLVESMKEPGKMIYLPPTGNSQAYGFVEGADSSLWHLPELIYFSF